MTLTSSTMNSLGFNAPDFELPDTVSDKSLSLSDCRGEQGTLVLFICNHCPYVKHLQQALAQLGRDFSDTGISLVAISANDVQAYPQDAPEHMRRFAEHNGITFPYLYDESQAVARSYGAVCTPDIYLFDEHLACVYRGQFDDSRPGNAIPVTGRDIRAAMAALLAGEPVSAEQQPSVGCSIKWKYG